MIKHWLRFWHDLFFTHDFEMVFTPGTLNYRLLCRCGKEAADMRSAIGGF